jgi:hypothetical protein
MKYFNLCRLFAKRPLLLIESVIFSCLFLFPASSLNADDPSRIRYISFDSEGNERWKAQAEIVAMPVDIEGLFILTEKGTGSFTGYRDKISWTARLEFERKKDYIRPIRLENRVSDKSGREIVIERQEFDYKNQKASSSRTDLVTKETQEETFKFRGDIINRLLLPLYIQRFLKDGKKEESVSILSPEPRLYKINIFMVSEDQIDIDGKKIAAYKLCIDPQLGLLNILKALVPRKAYSWHSADQDYRWLKYEGPEVGLSSEDIKIVTDTN